MTVRSGNFPVLKPNAQLLRENARMHPGVDLSAVELMVEFARVASEFFAEADAFFAEFGISRARFAVLVTLIGAPQGLGPAQIADSLQVTRATMTGLIDTLEKARYVERRDDPNDRRMYTVVITAAGRSFLEELLPGNWRRATVMMKVLSARERTDLLRLLGKLDAGIHEARIARDPGPQRARPLRSRS